MADDDRFERRLSGRGWRSAYRLAAGGSPTTLLVDSFMKAAAHALRNQAQSPSLPGVVNVLYESLNSPALCDTSDAPDDLRTFERLTARLDEILDADSRLLGTTLAVRAAEKVFFAQPREGRYLSKEQVRDRLGEVFVADLVDHQCLSRVRDGIAEENGRTHEQQHAWERELREQMRPQARKLFQSAAEASGGRGARAPKRTAAPPRSLEAQLREPLVSLHR